MSQICEVCNHDRRIEVDRLLVEGKSRRRIAIRFGLSYSSLENHAVRHLTRQLVTAYEKKSLTEGMDLLGRIDKILTRAEQIFERNFNRGRDMVALKALAEQRNVIDLLSRISMFLHEARALELQSKQGSYQAQREQEERERASVICDRLNPAELDLWERLARKINNESDEPVVPYHETEWPGSVPAEPMPLPPAPTPAFKRRQSARDRHEIRIPRPNSTTQRSNQYDADGKLVTVL